MQSNPMKVTDNLPPRPVPDVASPILSLAATLPLAQSVTSVATKPLAVQMTPVHSLDTQAEKQKMVPLSTSIDPDPQKRGEEPILKPERSTEYLLW